jgi:hypothetical protein
LIVAKDQLTFQKHIRAVIRRLSELELLIKPSKSSLVSAQRLEHPDLVIDTANMTLSAPSNKIQDRDEKHYG